MVEEGRVHQFYLRKIPLGNWLKEYHLKVMGRYRGVCVCRGGGIGIRGWGGGLSPKYCCI